MRESIGSTFLYSMIFLFLIIMFGILSATISYYKAFKVNERMAASIEKFEGYNKLSRDEIKSYLSSIGYTSDSDSDACPETKSGGTRIATGDGSHLYCIYYFEDDTSSADEYLSSKKK